MRAARIGPCGSSLPPPGFRRSFYLLEPEVAVTSVVFRVPLAGRTTLKTTSPPADPPHAEQHKRRREEPRIAILRLRNLVAGVDAAGVRFDPRAEELPQG